MRLTLLLIFMATAARATDELVAVLPIDASNAAIQSADRVTFEEAVRTATADALGPLGYTVLTGETTLKILSDNGVDAAKACEAACALEAAQELKAKLFVSGTMTTSEGQQVAFVRLFDSGSGKQIASVQVEGATVRDLRQQFAQRAPGFYGKALGKTAPPPDGTTPFVDLRKVETPVIGAGPTPLDQFATFGGLPRDADLSQIEGVLGPADSKREAAGQVFLEYGAATLGLVGGKLKTVTAALVTGGSASQIPTLRLLGMTIDDAVKDIGARPATKTSDSAMFNLGTGRVTLFASGGRVTRLALDLPAVLKGSNPPRILRTVKIESTTIGAEFDASLVDDAGVAHKCDKLVNLVSPCELRDVVLGRGMLTLQGSAFAQAPVDLVNGPVEAIVVEGGAAGSRPLLPALLVGGAAGAITLIGAYFYGTTENNGLLAAGGIAVVAAGITFTYTSAEPSTPAEVKVVRAERPASDALAFR